MARRKSTFRMSDITRAAKALTAAGYLVASAVITPDGAIQITTTEAPHAATPIASPVDPSADEQALLAEIERLEV